MLTTQHGVDRGCPGTDEGRDSSTNRSKGHHTIQSALQPFDTARRSNLLKGCESAALSALCQQHSEQQTAQQHAQLKQKDESQQVVGDTDGDDTTQTLQQAVTFVRRDSDQQQGNGANDLQQRGQIQQAYPVSTCQSSSAQSEQEPHLITGMLGNLPGRQPTQYDRTGTGKAVAATALKTVLAAVVLAGREDSSVDLVKPDLQQQLQHLTPASSTAVAPSATLPAADEPYAKKPPPAGAAVVSTRQFEAQETAHMPVDSGTVCADQPLQQHCMEDCGYDSKPQLPMLLRMLQQQHKVNALGQHANALARQVNTLGQQQEEDTNEHQKVQLEQNTVGAPAAAAAAAAAAGANGAGRGDTHATAACLSDQISRELTAAAPAAVAPFCAVGQGAVVSAAAERALGVLLQDVAAADSSKGHSEGAAAAMGWEEQQPQLHEHRPKRPLMPWEELEVSANHKKLPEGRTQQHEVQRPSSDGRHETEHHGAEQQQQEHLLMLRQLAARVHNHQQQLPKAEELGLDPNDPAYAAAVAAPLPVPAGAAAAVPSSSDTFVPSLNCDFKVWLPELLQRKRLFEECPTCGDSLIVKYFNISCPTQAHCYNCCPQYSRVVDACTLRAASGGQVEAALAIAKAAAAATDGAAAGSVLGQQQQQQQQQQLGQATTLGLGSMQEQQYKQQSQPAQRKQKRHKPQKQVEFDQHQGPLLLPLYHSALRGSIAAANPHDLLSLHVNIAGVKAFQRNNGTKPFMLLQSQVWGGNSGQRIPGVLQAAGLGGGDGSASQSQRQSQRRQGKAKDSSGAAAAAAAAAVSGAPGGVDCIGCRLYRAEAASQQLQQQNPQQQLFCSLACKWQQAGLESFLLQADEKALEWEAIPSKPLAGGGVRLGRKRKMDGIEADAFWKGTFKKGKGGKAAVAAVATAAAAAWDPAVASLGGHRWEPVQQLQARVPKSRKQQQQSVQDMQQQAGHDMQEAGIVGRQYAGMDPLHLLEAARQLSEQQEQPQQPFEGYEQQEHKEEGKHPKNQQPRHAESAIEPAQQ